MYDKDTEDYNMMDNRGEGFPPEEIPQENLADLVNMEAPSEATIELPPIGVEDIIVSEDYIDSADTDSPSVDVASENKNINPKIFALSIILLGLLLSGAMLFIYADNIPFISDAVQKIKGNQPETIKESDVQNVDTVAQGSDVDEDIMKILNEASSSTGVSIDKNTIAQQNAVPEVPNMNEVDIPTLPGAQDNSNMYKYTGNIGRLDPFNPSGGSNQLFDVIVPPTNPTPDPEAQKLLTLKISGIMYTPDSPSAIINIAGQDQLVRKGDKFNGFSVEGIGKDKVTVRNGSNTYTASVGEIFNINQVNVNAIPNLNRKFAGPYSKGKGTVIEINNL